MISDTLRLAMEMQASVCSNVVFVSNDLVYSEEGTVTGFTEPLITSSNKGELQHHFSGFADRSKVRLELVWFV